MRVRPAALAFVLGLAPAAVHAAPPKQDPDWPCMQRLVPVLTPSMFWAGPITAADWRADPRVSELVAAVAPRSVPAQQGAARIAAFEAGLPAADRVVLSLEAFTGIVDETNRQRVEIIDSLRASTRRERGMADIIARVTAEMRALPADADDARREEVTQRRRLLIRQFEETEQTMRYACEVPVGLEGRLGDYARSLGGGSGQVPAASSIGDRGIDKTP
jgi:hypothetical protein